jgi:hypothetical protein
MQYLHADYTAKYDCFVLKMMNTTTTKTTFSIY